ncbi:hypothetical protein [Mediterraneibacter gnavus]|nr:hypothetical protein [Mediterraneibacter gnavus]
MTLPELKDKLKTLDLPIAYRCFCSRSSTRITVHRILCGRGYRILCG